MANVPSLEPLWSLHLHALPLLCEPVGDTLAAEALVGPAGGVRDALGLGQVHRGELSLESGLLDSLIVLVARRRLGRPRQVLGRREVWLRLRGEGGQGESAGL